MHVVNSYYPLHTQLVEFPGAMLGHCEKLDAGLDTPFVLVQQGSFYLPVVTMLDAKLLYTAVKCLLWPLCTSL